MPDKETLMQQATKLMDAMKRNEAYNKYLDELLELCMKDWNEYDKDERQSDEQPTQVYQHTKER